MSSNVLPFPQPAPIGRIPDEAAPATPTAPESPYQPLNLPTVEPKQVPVPEQKPVQDLGATSHAGGIAYLADQVLRGAMQGYDAAQQKKSDQFNKKLAAQQAIYNDQAKQLHDMAVAGVDPNSDEFKQAKNRVLTSWQATMQTIGERIPQPKQSKKSQQGQANGQDQSSLLARAMNHQKDPQDALQAVYQGAVATGPPVFHQIAPYLTPQYLAQKKQGAQTAATQATGQGDATAAAAGKAKLEHDLATAVTSGAPQEDIDKIKNQLTELAPTPVEKPLNKPDTQEFYKPDGTKFVGQWDPTKKKWTYPNGEEIPQELLGKEAKLVPKASASQWAAGLNAYAQSHKADPNDWQTIRAYEQDQYSAKNPLAERRLALAQRNSDIAAAGLALRQSSNDFNQMEKIFKQIGPDTAIQGTAKAADEYTSHPTGPGDVALTLAFFEVAKAADPGSGSGIRFTQQEQKLIQGARGWADAAQSNVENWGKGTLYDGAQRAVMAKLIKQAAQRSNEATATYLGAAEKLAPKAAAAVTGGAGRVSVKAPDGSVHEFPTQAAADQFKKAAGIQ